MGNGRDEETRLRSEGRDAFSPPVDFVFLNVALDTELNRLRPTASAWSPYPFGLGLSACDSVRDSSWLAIEVARDRPRDVRRPGGSRGNIPSSRAWETSVCARYAIKPLAGMVEEVRMEDGSGVIMRFRSATERTHSHRRQKDGTESGSTATIPFSPPLDVVSIFNGRFRNGLADR